MDYAVQIDVPVFSIKALNPTSILFVMGPGLPPPTFLPLISMMGEISDPVPVPKTSSAANSSDKETSLS
jgi:hypothetical protein